MNELERILRETGATLEWPATPDLAAAVAGRIGSAAPRRVRPAQAHFGRLRRPLAIALAAFLVLAAGAAAVPAVRDPVLDFLGLRSVKIERVPQLPRARERTEFGVRTTLSEAHKQLGFAPLVAAHLGRPRIYVDDTPPGGRISLVYRGGRLVLTEFEGRLERPYLQKMLGPGTNVDRVRVNGERALWISGALHVVVFLDARHEIRSDQTYLAGNTLLWRHGNLLLRLEGARSRGEALRIARAAG